MDPTLIPTEKRPRRSPTTFLAPSKRSAFELGVSAEFVEIVDEGVRGRLVRVETVALATSQLVEICISIVPCMQHAKKLRRASMTRRMQHAHEACIRMHVIKGSFRCQPFWKR